MPKVSFYSCLGYFLYSYPYPYPHPWSYPYPRFRNAVVFFQTSKSTVIHLCFKLIALSRSRTPLGQLVLLLLFCSYLNGIVKSRDQRMLRTNLHPLKAKLRLIALCEVNVRLVT